MLPGLIRNHRVYALDLRGHGRSSRPGRYSFELMRDARLVTIDAGHNVHRDRPAEFLQAVGGFLAAPPGR